MIVPVIAWDNLIEPPQRPLRPAFTLQFVAHTLFRDMFATLAPRAATGLEVAESWEQMCPLLQHLYVEGPSGLEEGLVGDAWSRAVWRPHVAITPAPLADIASALEVARKYGCTALTQRCQELLCCASFKLFPERRDALLARAACMGAKLRMQVPLTLRLLARRDGVCTLLRTMLLAHACNLPDAAARCETCLADRDNIEEIYDDLCANRPAVAALLDELPGRVTARLLEALLRACVHQ